MMKEHIDAEFADDVVAISFHPWKYGKSSNLTYLFFEELSKALAPYSTIFLVILFDMLVLCLVLRILR